MILNLHKHVPQTQTMTNYWQLVNFLFLFSSLGLGEGTGWSKAIKQIIKGTLKRVWLELLLDILIAIFLMFMEL